MLPAILTGQARRKHVRACILEDHAERIDPHADGTSAKFEKLDGSVYSFFRGSALLFYRDMPGTDARMPTVLLLGDVHPENFGVMPNRDNVPIFSVNDFDDEVSYGPFTWDLKRGATGSPSPRGRSADTARSGAAPSPAASARAMSRRCSVAPKTRPRPTPCSGWTTVRR